MPTTLILLCFEQSKLFPQDTAHWALYLQDESSSSGTVFHASKDSLTAGHTVYAQIQNMTPQTSKSLRASVVVASGLTLDDAALDVHCRAAAQGRPFDLVVNNCQKFCTQILQRLVNSGVLTEEQFYALPTKGFQPLM